MIEKRETKQSLIKTPDNKPVVKLEYDGKVLLLSHEFTFIKIPKGYLDDFKQELLSATNMTNGHKPESKLHPEAAVEADSKSPPLSKKYDLKHLAEIYNTPIKYAHKPTRAKTIQILEIVRDNESISNDRITKKMGGDLSVNGVINHTSSLIKMGFIKLAGNLHKYRKHVISQQGLELIKQNKPGSVKRDSAYFSDKHKGELSEVRLNLIDLLFKYPCSTAKELHRMYPEYGNISRAAIYTHLNKLFDYGNILGWERDQFEGPGPNSPKRYYILQEGEGAVEQNKEG